MSSKIKCTCSCPADSCVGRDEDVVNPPRRQLLNGSLAAGWLGVLGLWGLLRGYNAQARGVQTPDDALQELRRGNERFLRRTLTSFQEDLGLLRDKTAEKQEPFVAVLACADSRVPVELIFDQSIGKLFVVRVAGNIATPSVIASVEYGVAVLGVRALVVLGHSDCGAVKAATANQTAQGQISSIYPYIRSAIDASASMNVADVARTNAINQAWLLQTSSTVLAEHTRTGSLRIIPAFYNVANGQVAWL